MFGKDREDHENKKAEIKREWYRCQASVIYFINEYCWIYAAAEGQWVPFKLWPIQVRVVKDITENREVVIIKTRQIGFSWMFRAIMLHAAIFKPAINGVMFSKSLEDAKDLLSEELGLKGMYHRLPGWMKPSGGLVKDNAQEMALSNGSIVRARPYTQAEGQTYSHIFFDEFDRFPHGNDKILYNNVKPAMEKAVMIAMGSISDKTRPDSFLKNTYRAAKAGKNSFFPIFIPWNARPGRDQAWYDKELQEAIALADDDAAGHDWMYQQYPSTDEEAMAPATVNRRIPYHHLTRIFEEKEPLKEPEDAPSLPKLKIFREPEEGHEYVIGADPAEGVPGGDDSSADVLDKYTGEQVASLRGKFEPKKVFPSYLFQLAVYFNEAGILVERNNHGWGVLGELPELIAGRPGCNVEILEMPQDDKPGWLSSARGKALLYDGSAVQIKDQEVTIHDETTKNQLADIWINTLRASEGKHDDTADSFSLACVARNIPSRNLKGDLFF